MGILIFLNHRREPFVAREFFPANFLLGLHRFHQARSASDHKRNVE